MRLTYGVGFVIFAPTKGLKTTELGAFGFD